MPTARRHLSVDASMLCDSALMSAGQYAADICNVMFAWHVSMHGGALSRLYHYIAWSAGQQVELIVRDNDMPAI